MFKLILLFVFFYLIVFPCGVLLQLYSLLFGSIVKKNKPSFWVYKKKSTFAKKDFEQQHKGF